MFPVRILGIDAPEVGTPGGLESKTWMISRLEGKECDFIINRSQRVGKFGRLLAVPYEGGVNVAEESIQNNMSVTFGKRGEHEIPTITESIPEVFKEDAI